MNRALENKTKFILILLSAAVWVLASCAGHQLEVKSISKSENPQQLINQLDNDIAMARKNQVNVLAPTWFERADNSLNAAREGLEEGGLLAELLENVATGRAQLQRAEEIAQTSRSTIPDAIKAREPGKGCRGSQFWKFLYRCRKEISGPYRSD